MEQIENKLKSSPQTQGKQTSDPTDEDANGPKRPGQFKIDPCLIMDDIIEKLNLLDYSSKFCKVKQ